MPQAVATSTDRISRSSRVVAVIPARYQSSRFPGKALADIAGLPMIAHVYRRVADARVADEVIVATDDERIASAVRSAGGVARMTAAAHRTGTDRIAEVAMGLTCDIVVNVQGDEPLIEPDVIRAAVEPLLDDPELPMSTICRPISDAELHNPNVVKVVRDLEGNALYFSRAAIPWLGAGSLPPSPLPLPPSPCPLPPVLKHVGLYAYRRLFLLEFARLPQTPLEISESLEQLRALEHGFRVRAVLTEHDSIGVDTPEDLERVRRQLTTVART